MSMRIVGGLYRHRLIEYPNDMEHTRPTKDRIREAIFSAIGDLYGLTVLDLYSGSGAMGLEALSRNAKHCYFVDNSKIAIKTIQNNLNSLKIDSSFYNVLFKDDLLALNDINHKLNVVILDPPYKEGRYEEIISLLINKDLLAKNCIIICESDHLLELNKFDFSKIKDYKYGDIFVKILWRFEE